MRAHDVASQQRDYRRARVLTSTVDAVLEEAREVEPRDLRNVMMNVGAAFGRIDRIRDELYGDEDPSMSLDFIQDMLRGAMSAIERISGIKREAHCFDYFAPRWS